MKLLMSLESRQTPRYVSCMINLGMRVAGKASAWRREAGTAWDWLAHPHDGSDARKPEPNFESFEGRDVVTMTIYIWRETQTDPEDSQDHVLQSQGSKHITTMRLKLCVAADHAQTKR